MGLRQSLNGLLKTTHYYWRTYLPFLLQKYTYTLKTAWQKWRHKPVGVQGEQLAADYLKQRGLQIIKRNWRCGHGEIDLIARDDACLVFVEVKTRKAETLIPGFYAATQPRKQRALRKSCYSYIRQLRHRPKFYRFDVIEVRLYPHDQYTLNYHPNVPLFDKHAVCAY